MDLCSVILLPMLARATRLPDTPLQLSINSCNLVVDLQFNTDILMGIIHNSSNIHPTLKLQIGQCSSLETIRQLQDSNHLQIQCSRYEAHIFHVTFSAYSMLLRVGGARVTQHTERLLASYPGWRIDRQYAFFSC